MQHKNNSTFQSLVDQIDVHLPYLRRYARALTGTQASGDAHAAATLEAILNEPDALAGDALSEHGVRVALFAVFHRVWVSAGAPVATDDAASIEARAQTRLRTLTPNTREALLLNSIEELRFDQIAAIMEIPQSEAEELVRIAQREMHDAVKGRVMVIEDEPLIAMDINGIVTDMGHAVTGVARTRKAALDLLRDETPDLVLADIQLADGSSGIDAVRDILAVYPEMPTIFITAYPDRLLTGTRPEPAFLIPKPYTDEQVRSGVSQAMFFASTETLA